MQKENSGGTGAILMNNEAFLDLEREVEMIHDSDVRLICSHLLSKWHCEMCQSLAEVYAVVRSK